MATDQGLHCLLTESCIKIIIHENEKYPPNNPKNRKALGQIIEWEIPFGLHRLRMGRVCLILYWSALLVYRVCFNSYFVKTKEDNFQWHVYL